MALRKSKHNSSLEESIQDMQDEGKTNSKLTNEDDKTQQHKPIRVRVSRGKQGQQKSNTFRTIGVPESKMNK